MCQNFLPSCVGTVTSPCLTLCNPVDCSPPGSSLCPWDSPGKNTGVGFHALLLGIFPTWGSNSHLPVSPALLADSLPTEPPRKPTLILYAVLTNLNLASFINDKSILDQHPSLWWYFKMFFVHYFDWSFLFYVISGADFKKRWFVTSFDRDIE